MIWLTETIKFARLTLSLYEIKCEDMEIKIFVNNPLQENTVVLYDRTGEAVMSDCGCVSGEEERRLQDVMAKKKLKPVALLDTHMHIDHIFGNNFIKNTCTMIIPSPCMIESIIMT